jgi:hypothetical protein
VIWADFRREGEHTRFGMLLRAGTLQDLTSAYVRRLTDALGVQTVAAFA